MPIFDIQSERLDELSDTDLRELIARLCEAERERQGGHRNEVRWGGSQTAADGGLDVVVVVNSTQPPFTVTGSPLKRRNVGIQVKVSDLSRAAITTEMCPGGSLRPEISELAKRHGSYLIASARAHCSEKMLKLRVAAMHDAVANDPNKAKLELTFLDRTAISRWVSAHPSVAAWLRPRLKLLTLIAWQPLGRWSSTPEGQADDLICEQGLVFHIERRHAPLRNLPQALDEIRRLVHDGTRTVRIAGLSGIGKSRIVQALFEPVGSVSPLPASHAIYTDLGHSPDPTPNRMLEDLIKRAAPAILVVDNCPPDTHQTLARKLAGRAEQAKAVRLITIEYDVRTDRPEETDVIRIEAEGADIVEALLRRRRNDLSTGDARRLAELAQGNARLGLALAQAAPPTGSLTAFDDAALFNRLFWQRNKQNDELARAAEVLSLVYSFEVKGDEQPDELTFLGSLAELSRTAMHRHASTLLDRGLTQARGKWRAVLPHALANRLARQALRSIPLDNIADRFADNLHLCRSLARRLSYLHDCQKAQSIVTRWMEAGGPLHGLKPDLQVLEAVCHLIPKDTLRIVNTMIAKMQVPRDYYSHFDRLPRIIARIALSEAIFPHACESLVSMAIAIDKQYAPKADNVLSNLFRLYLSGTLAKTKTRVQVAQQYLLSNNSDQNSRGIRVLKSALQVSYRSSSIPSFDDARPNTCGWEPHGTEIEDWFSQWLDLAAKAALNGPLEVRDSVRKTLSDEIDGIWRRIPTLRAKIGDIARQLHEATPWMEGWHAFQRMLNFTNESGSELPEEDLEMVRQLIDDIAPTDLASRVCAEIIRGESDHCATGGDYKAAEAHREKRLELLGQELAVSPDALRAVGTYLFEHKTGFLYSLGTGLVQGSKEPERLWDILRDLYLEYSDRSPQIDLLSGFLHQLDESNQPTAETIRAECRSTPTLRRIYAIFLPQGVLPTNEFKHVVEIASEHETAAWVAERLSDIAWRKRRALNDEQRILLLRALLNRDDGAVLVVDAMRKLGYFEKDSRNAWPEALRSVGLDAVNVILSYKKLDTNLDLYMAEALSYCLRSDNLSDANRLMGAVIARAAQRYGSTYDVKHILAMLVREFPHVFLDKVFPDGANQPSIEFYSGLDHPPLLHVPPEVLIAWCSENPTRWSKITPNISPFSQGSGDDNKDISPLAIEYLNAAPCPEKVMEAYLQQLNPTNCSGSRANIMEHRLTSIEALSNHLAPKISRTIARLAPSIRTEIDSIRQADQKEERELDQRFE